MVPFASHWHNYWKKDVFAWNDEATKEFNLLRELMIIPLVLVLPDLKKLFVVEINAFVMGVGVIVIQERHLISYISKSWGPKQQLSVYDREMMDENTICRETF